MGVSRDEYLLEAKGIKKWFPIGKNIFKKNVDKHVKAVDGIDISIKRGETLGIVGESGCGKSTLGRALLKLIEPTDGTIIFDGKDITNLPEKKLKNFKQNAQIIFQDPYASLNPRMVVSDIIAEPMDIQKTYETKKERLSRVLKLMEICGLNRKFINRYPHEFSGGQRQRIGIARALSLKPKFIVCDEPVSALDVSIQSQIINLLMEIQSEYDISLLFISHDLSVVEYISDRVAVMYLGKIVEHTKAKEMFNNPVHPYTKALIQSIPAIGGKNIQKFKTVLQGDIPSPVDPPSGCTFHTRCPIAKKECSDIEPKLVDHGNEHLVSCSQLESNLDR